MASPNLGFKGVDRSPGGRIPDMGQGVSHAGEIAIEKVSQVNYDYESVEDGMSQNTLA